MPHSLDAGDEVDEATLEVQRIAFTSPIENYRVDCYNQVVVTAGLNLEDFDTSVPKKECCVGHDQLGKHRNATLCVANAAGPRRRTDAERIRVTARYYLQPLK